MFDSNYYEFLVPKYGSYSSWAIWDYADERNTTIIDENYTQLHSEFVLLGLNISAPIREGHWSNFHGGKHDRKIKYACNDTILRGSYLTDIFKGIPESKSLNFRKLLTNEVVRENVEFFVQEMADIKLSSTSKFIIFGTDNSLIAQLFNKYFKPAFPNDCMYYYHYSYYKMSDKDWVTGLWRKIGLTESFDLTRERYYKEAEPRRVSG